MKMRTLLCLLLSMLFLHPAPLLAQDSANVLEIRQLQASLAVINAELRADLEQVLMLQEAIRLNSRATLEEQGRSPDMVMYEDMAAAQRRAIQRETAINARLDELLARSADLDARKQTLLERIRELTELPAAASTAPQ